MGCGKGASRETAISGAGEGTRPGASEDAVIPADEAAQSSPASSAIAESDFSDVEGEETDSPGGAPQESHITEEIEENLIMDADVPIPQTASCSSYSIRRKQYGQDIDDLFIDAGESREITTEPYEEGDFVLETASGASLFYVEGRLQYQRTDQQDDVHYSLLRIWRDEHKGEEKEQELQGLWGGIWAVAALCLSAYIPNPHMCLAMPVVAIFELDMFQNALQIPVSMCPAKLFYCRIMWGSEGWTMAACVAITVLSVEALGYLFTKKVRWRVYNE